MKNKILLLPAVLFCSALFVVIGTTINTSEEKRSEFENYLIKNGKAFTTRASDTEMKNLVLTDRIRQHLLNLLKQ